MDEYKLVRSNDVANFEKLCNEKIKQGFAPQGGVCVTSLFGDIRYTQAFVLIDILPHLDGKTVATLECKKTRDSYCD
jgi:hypothetical protein